MAYATKNPLMLLLLLLTITVALVQASNPNGETPWSIRDKTIQSHIQKWMRDPDATAREYGHIRHWDMRNVTSFRNLFAFNEKFNEDISQWNVTGVTDFTNMFWDATAFDGNLSAWNVRNALSMKTMFSGASRFTGKGLEQWADRLHKVEDMYNMFMGSAIQADLSGWNVSKVSNFRGMFINTPQFTQKLCWDIRSGANTFEMFNHSNACLDPNCVDPRIAKMAGCSGAYSMALWMGASLAGLLSFLAML